jgi:hypothetical protein
MHYEGAKSEMYSKCLDDPFRHFKMNFIEIDDPEDEMNSSILLRSDSALRVAEFLSVMPNEH